MLESTEDEAVKRLIKAHARELSRGLRSVSDDDRVFLIITAPARRSGRCFVIGNLEGDDIDKFLRIAIKYSDLDTSLESFEVD